MSYYRVAAKPRRKSNQRPVIDRRYELLGDKLCKVTVYAPDLAKVSNRRARAYPPGSELGNGGYRAYVTGNE